MKIRSIEIHNFRSIQNQKIDVIQDALVLVGQNNTGKSAFIGAVRAFFGDYEITAEDFYRDTTEIKIKIELEISKRYMEKSFRNPKIGIHKMPSSAAKFNGIKKGTDFEDITFANYKDIIEKIPKATSSDTFKESYQGVYNLWIKTVRQELGIEGNRIIVICKNDKNSLKNKYLNENGDSFDFITAVFPPLAFIDDDRKFTEEETAKPRTLTNDLFGNNVLRKGRESDEEICSECINQDCEECLKLIYQKDVQSLDIGDLEKLLKRCVDKNTQDISEIISHYFQNNYMNGFQIILDARSNVDKSFFIKTKIYDPNIQRKIDLSNVGSGLRALYVLSLLQAYQEIGDKNNTIFLIEEPEIYLHPSMQKLMGNILLEISKQNQLFFTTHSPLLLRNFELEKTKKVILNEQQETIFEEADLKDILNELGYSTEDIVEKNFVIIVEGKGDKRCLEEIISYYYNVDLNKIYFLEAAGCRNIESYATLRFLGITEYGENFLIIRDSDSAEQEKIKAKLLNCYKENLGVDFEKRMKPRTLVLKYYSLENYFLNPIVLEKIRVIKNEEDFCNKISDFLNREKSKIVEYIRNNNSEDADRVARLESLIYRDCSILDKIEDIKKYVRGHNLLGVFGKINIQKYLENADEDDFAEILDNLDNLTYFKENRIK